MTFEEKVQTWMQLEKEFNDFLVELRPVADSLPADDLKKMSKLIAMRVKLEFELLDRIGDGAVLDQLTDPKVRAAVIQLMAKSRERIDKELDEDPLEMDDETTDEAWDFVYELIGTPKELLLKRRRISCIVALAEIPERIRELFAEAQVCYITDQQNAVMALGRMMLEYTVTDIGVRLNLFPEPDTVDDFYREYPPYDRADRVLGKGGSRRQRFRDLYRAGSQTIHSSRDLQQLGTADYLEEVIKFIGEIYSANHHQLRKSSPV